jgi:membrane protein insertase Oxa1/YidC/SpoIIIJ
LGKKRFGLMEGYLMPIQESRMKDDCHKIFHKRNISQEKCIINVFLVVVTFIKKKSLLVIYKLCSNKSIVIQQIYTIKIILARTMLNLEE